MLTRVVPAPPQRGDGHGRFGLGVDLDEALAHDVERILDIGEIHRPAAIDHGLDAVAVEPARLGRIDQAAHHGRCREQGDIAQSGREVEHLVRMEAAGLGHHVAGAGTHVLEIVDPGAVGHRRGVENGVLGSDGLDIHDVAQRLHREIAVR